MKQFCAACGHGTEYNGKKPIFCSQCGESYDAAFKRTIPVETKPVKSSKKRKVEIEENEDYEDDYEEAPKSTVRFKKPAKSSTTISVGRFMKVSDLAQMGDDARIEREQGPLSVEEMKGGDGNSAIEVTRSNSNVLSNLLKVTAQNRASQSK